MTPRCIRTALDSKSAKRGRGVCIHLQRRRKMRGCKRDVPCFVLDNSLNPNHIMYTYPYKVTATAALASDWESEFTAMAPKIVPFGPHEPIIFGACWMASHPRPRA